MYFGLMPRWTSKLVNNLVLVFKSTNLTMRPKGFALNQMKFMICELLFGEIINDL